jgi:hypothetical protein
VLSVVRGISSAAVIATVAGCGAATQVAFPEKPAEPAEVELVQIAPEPPPPDEYTPDEPIVQPEYDYAVACGRG